MANQIELDIQGLSHEGVGVARHDGKVIFVADALPGDRVLATITQSKRKFSQATIASLIQPSAHRVEPPCRYFATCGGCTQQHISAAGQLEFKQANLAALLQRELGDVVADDVWQTPLDGEQWYYRHRIRLQRKGESLGFFAAQSNKLVDIAQCLVLDERINNK